MMYAYDRLFRAVTEQQEADELSSLATEGRSDSGTRDNITVIAVSTLEQNSRSAVIYTTENETLSKESHVP